MSEWSRAYVTLRGARPPARNLPPAPLSEAEVVHNVGILAVAMNLMKTFRFLQARQSANLSSIESVLT
jgi:hypothetical protein